MSHVSAHVIISTLERAINTQPDKVWEIARWPQTLPVPKCMSFSNSDFATFPVKRWSLLLHSLRRGWTIWLALFSGALTNVMHSECHELVPSLSCWVWNSGDHLHLDEPEVIYWRGHVENWDVSVSSLLVTIYVNEAFPDPSASLPTDCTNHVRLPKPEGSPNQSTKSWEISIYCFQPENRKFVALLFVNKFENADNFYYNATC